MSKRTHQYTKQQLESIETFGFSSILELRKKYLIPKDGFKNTNDFDKWIINQWEKLQGGEFKFVDNKVDPLLGIEDFRDLMGDFGDNESVLELYQYRNTIYPVPSIIIIDLFRILDRFHISHNHWSSLFNYMGWGIFSEIDSINLLPEKGSDYLGYAESINLKIYPNTTLEDVKELWPRVVQWQKSLNQKKENKPTKQKASPKFNLHKRVFELRNAGKDNKQINQIITEEFPINNTKFKGHALTAVEINRICRDFKNKMK